MRRRWLRNTPTLAAFLAMVLVAGSLAIALDPYGAAGGQRLSAGPAGAIPLPGPEVDRDLDGYHDDVDLWNGSAVLRLQFDGSALPSGSYLLVGTQDDHWRFGTGRELQWNHIVDPDPTGVKAGSQTWSDEAIRTGTWVQSRPDADLTNWTAILDVREDQADIAVEVEHWVDRLGRNHLAGTWSLTVDNETAHIEGTAGVPLGTPLALTNAETQLGVRATWGLDVNLTDAADIAAHWAPNIHFDSEEQFYPGDPWLMERFHGFARKDLDLRTWSLSFSNGRDGYRLLVADFDGDRQTNHQDVALLWDILREGPGTDRIHARVGLTTNDMVVVQYWMLYPYNFVVGDDGREVITLAHAGDREFVQLLFDDVANAMNGTPSSVAFSQHYGGIRFDSPSLDEAPFVDGRLTIFPARGSHASYPVPGDDSRLRNAFAGYGDRFDGAGDLWTADDYTVELFTSQPWHLGYRWGPLTRFHRELGTSGQPLLVHSFVYPWHEPVRWAATLDLVAPEELPSLYGGPE